MRSSDLRSRALRLAWCLVVASSILPACSPVPVSSQSASSAPPPCVAADGSPAKHSPDAIANLRRAAETSPLYAVLASKTGQASSCRVSGDADAITLEYTFRDGGSLRVVRNSQIESSSQEARLASPLAEGPVEVLTRAEQASFGDKGCGINWRQPETKPAGDDPKTTESVYRGDTCNCQARVRRDASGRVLSLSIRSAC